MHTKWVIQIIFPLINHVKRTVLFCVTYLKRRSNWESRLSFISVSRDAHPKIIASRRTCLIVRIRTHMKSFIVSRRLLRSHCNKFFHVKNVLFFLVTVETSSLLRKANVLVCKWRYVYGIESLLHVHSAKSVCSLIQHPNCYHKYPLS